MTTSNKLWFGFGTLTALLVLAGVVILLRGRAIERAVYQQADIARPRASTAKALTIRVIGYAAAVQEFVYEGDPSTRKEADQYAADLNHLRADYEQLATTDRQRDLANRLTQQWDEMHKLGQKILRAEKRSPRSPDVIRLGELSRGLETFLDAEVQAEANATYNERRDVTLNDIKTIMGLALALLGGGALLAVGTSGIVARGILRAETALKKAHNELEERVRERTAELAATNVALERSNRELERFASVASHDLQEPLRKIQAFGDRLRAKCGDKLGEQGHEYLERVLTSAARMRRLIDDLLSFSRVTTKGQQFVPTDLNALARDAVSDLEGRIQDTGGRVEVGELPTLDVDPVQMRQLLQNLIANGLKFHRTDVPPVVRLRGRLFPDGPSGANGEAPPGAYCEIAVEDNGIGFEEVYLDRIFELFQRLHGRSEYEGTGIGLAICRKIVERHGGHITARSTPGQGATFLVTLPVHRPQEGEAR